MRRVAACVLAALTLGAAPRSGFETMTPALQAMQRDDLANPGMLYVEEGEAVWGREGCDRCHTVAAMRGVAARYPALDAATAAPIDLTGRIAQCRQARQGRPPLPREGAAMLALSAFVAHQSRGLGKRKAGVEDIVDHKGPAPGQRPLQIGAHFASPHAGPRIAVGGQP